MSKIQGLKNLTQPPYAEMIGSDLVACVQYAIDTLYLQDLVDAEQELSDAQQVIPGLPQLSELDVEVTRALAHICEELTAIRRNTSKQGPY